MNNATWWQRLFQNRPHTARRTPAGRSTRFMEVERLEDRLVPVTATTNILVGSVRGGVFTPSYIDGPGSGALTSYGAYMVAPNLRSAVNDANGLSGKVTILLQTTTSPQTTYELTNGDGGQLGVGAANLTITNRYGAISTINGNFESRLFEVYGGAVLTLDHLQLQDGTESGDGSTAEGGAIFMDTNATLTLSNDRLTQNSATAYGGFHAYGGAIYDSGTVTTSPKKATNAIAGTPTGAINLTIVNTTLDHNTANGGSSYGGNGGGAEGGGLYATNGGAIAITASTFNNNSALAGSAGGEGGNGGNAYGGGASFDATSGNISVVNSTFASNVAQGGSGSTVNSYGGNAVGGGIFSASIGGSTSLVNDTIAFNQVVGGVGEIAPTEAPKNQISHQGLVNGNFGTGYGGGVALEQGTLNVLNTIIARNADSLGTQLLSVNLPGPLKGINRAGLNFAENDIAFDFSTFTDLGHNLIGLNDPGAGFTKPTDFLNVDPGFSSAGLANNGGPTQTIAIVGTSLAVNHGDDSVLTTGGAYGPLGLSPLLYDQRGPGFARRSGAHVDIGAFEFVVAPAGKGRDLLVALYG